MGPAGGQRWCWEERSHSAGAAAGSGHVPKAKPGPLALTLADTHLLIPTLGQRHCPALGTGGHSPCLGARSPLDLGHLRHRELALPQQGGSALETAAPEQTWARVQAQQGVCCNTVQGMLSGTVVCTGSFLLGPSCPHGVLKLFPRKLLLLSLLPSPPSPLSCLGAPSSVYFSFSFCSLTAAQLLGAGYGRQADRAGVCMPCL